MSLDFDGVDDNIASGATQTLGDAITIAAWFDADAQGELDAGAISAHGPAGTGSRSLFGWDGSAGSKALRFLAQWTVAGSWAMTTGFTAVTGWKWAGVTYDGGSTANQPVMYTLDGSTFSTLTVGSGLTEVQAPVGAYPADNLYFIVGNREDGDITWDGRLAEVVVYKRILTEAEMKAVALLGVNAVPDHFNYLPFDSTAQQLGSSGTAFTITGAVAGANPPTRPAGRKG